jgi:glyoxylase-like metal-dependent hydrolase (beta-lactamase superfamily II)
VAVIDPGPALPDHLAAIEAALPGERVSHILITHHHSDHSPLARPLSASRGAKVWGRPVETPVMEDAIQLEAGYDAFVPDIAIAGGEVFEGPGWTLEAIHTPGHTSNHICYALAEENALFSGDHIMGWSTTVITPPDGDMGDYLRSLAKVRERGFSTLWPTHGPPVTDTAPFIDAYIAHRRDRERQILARLAAGDTRIKAMVPAIYVGVDPRLHAPAAHSVLAQMIELVKQGAVVSDGPPSLDSDYRLA